MSDNGEGGWSGEVAKNEQLTTYWKQEVARNEGSPESAILRWDKETLVTTFAASEHSCYPVLTGELISLHQETTLVTFVSILLSFLKAVSFYGWREQTSPLVFVNLLFTHP